MGFGCTRCGQRAAAGVRTATSLYERDWCTVCACLPYAGRRIGRAAPIFCRRGERRNAFALDALSHDRAAALLAKLPPEITPANQTVAQRVAACGIPFRALPPTTAPSDDTGQVCASKSHVGLDQVQRTGADRASHASPGRRGGVATDLIERLESLSVARDVSAKQCLDERAARGPRTHFLLGSCP